MRRILLALGLILIGNAALAHNRDYDDEEFCTRNHFRFNDDRAYVTEETINAGNPRNFKVTTQSSPISIRGGNGGGYTITVCKAAEFEQDLDDIHVSVDGGELRATGPSGNRWLVSYRIAAPNGGNIAVSTRNGPISIRDIDATMRVELRNGPLLLENAGGNIDVDTTNGPVTLRGGSGTMNVRLVNGPLFVDLSGSHFNGTLDASAKNGPLTLEVPEGYGSGVEVEVNGRGPISCRAAGCAAWRASRDDDYDRDRPTRIDLGSGPTNVHISTDNGPVTIRED